MEVRIAPAFLFGGLGIIALFVVYRALPPDLRCSSLGVDPWTVEDVHAVRDNESSSSSSSSCSKTSSSDEKSIAQVLKEKVQMGLLTDDAGNSEFAGLDVSTRALLAEISRTMTTAESAAAAMAGRTASGLFHFDYGVARVVRRLVVCSAYRTSLREFTVISLSPDYTVPTSNPDFRNLPPKDPALKRTCTWLENGSAEAPHFGSVQEMNETGRSTVGNGVARFRWIGEHHEVSYDVLLIHCSFPEPVGTDLAGGFLYLNITHGSLDSSPTELVPVFHEQPEKLNTSLYEFPRKFQYEFAYCSGPIFTTLTATHVKQFLMYHYVLLEEDVHFFVYDSQGIDSDTMAVLQPLIDAGRLTIVDFRKESKYHTWYHSQDLAINDCLYRSRDIANWVLFWDMDEYLHVLPPRTLKGLLEQHKDAPWISFGKIDFALSHCAPNKTDSNTATAGVGTEWAVERMLYRQQNPICGEWCKGDKGARKWMANPRKVRAGRIHAVADFSDKGGVVLSTKVARMNHYRGLVASRGQLNCQQIRDPSLFNSTKNLDGRTTLWSDSELADLVSSTLKSSSEALQMFGGTER